MGPASSGPRSSAGGIPHRVAEGSQTVAPEGVQRNRYDVVALQRVCAPALRTLTALAVFQNIEILRAALALRAQKVEERALGHRWNALARPGHIQRIREGLNLLPVLRKALDDDLAYRELANVGKIIQRLARHDVLA